MSELSPRLLVSVRSAAEAEAALAGGAHLIDVKEPRRGSLGRADDATIREVLDTVAGRRPVSAALGELSDAGSAAGNPGKGLAFVKWGLAGTGGRPDWRERWREARRQVAEADATCGVVAVAYADWQRAAAPSVEAVAALARERPGGVLLVDTFDKKPCPETGTPVTLRDLIPLGEIVGLCRFCREAGVRVALAGSLGAAEIEALRPARPDWFAVRGAACDRGRRAAAVSAGRVRELVALLG